MTKIPRIASFSKLGWYDVSFNAIPFMSQSTLLFNAPVNLVDLKNIGLTAIEGGAFLGMSTCRLRYQMFPDFDDFDFVRR